MGFKIINKSKTMTIEKRLKLLKRSASKRDISVDLNIGFYRKLLKIGCVYCGLDLKDEKGYCLDRHDNSKGYTMENVSPCCGNCNRSKGSMSHFEFISYIERAFKFQQGKLNEFCREISSKEVESINTKIKNKSFYRNSDNLKLEGTR